MNGYRVVSSLSDTKVGHIVGADGDYYIVQRRLGRGCYPLPKRYATVVPEEREVRMSMSKDVLCKAPKVDRNHRVKEAETAAYYGE